MKITFIGGRNINKLGGIETYMFNLCSELVKRGYTPIVYCESDRTYTEYVNGFVVHHWKSPKSVYLCKIFLGLKSTLHALIFYDKVEVFHYNAWPPSLWSWIPRLCGRKSLMMGHGLEWKRTKYSAGKQRIMRYMEAITARLNNHLVMCSEEQTRYFQSEYGKRCTTISTAVNLPDITNIESNILNKYSLQSNKYFLYLGRLVQDKNPDYLIRAYVKSGITDFKLVIAGANEAQPDYVDYLKSIAAVNSNIIFTGAVYGSDKERLLSDCTAFCIPSTVEGLAITLLEAMSYSKPVIASNILANIEGLGQDGGFWCEPENVESLASQLLYCSKNTEDLDVSGHKNRLRVEHLFTWDKVTDKYINFIRQICD